jgi:hypothetical protein
MLTYAGDGACEALLLNFPEDALARAYARERGAPPLAYAHVCSRMLTYAHVCSRMLTYAHVCSRMLKYADVC